MSVTRNGIPLIGEEPTKPSQMIQDMARDIAKQMRAVSPLEPAIEVKAMFSAFATFLDNQHEGLLNLGAEMHSAVEILQRENEELRERLTALEGQPGRLDRLFEVLGLGLPKRDLSSLVSIEGFDPDRFRSTENSEHLQEPEHEHQNHDHTQDRVDCSVQRQQANSPEQNTNDHDRSDNG